MRELYRRDVDGKTHGWQAQLAPAGGLLAHLPQQPVAQRDDQTRLLGDRNELLGRDLTQLDTVPAQQRLEADDLQAAQVNLRLVADRELTGAHRVTQAPFQFQLPVALLAHVIGREAEVVLAPGFDLIHGTVSELYECLGCLTVSREDADADAGAYCRAGAVQFDGTAQARKQLAGARGQRIDVVDPGDGQHELITTEPAGKLLAARAFQHALSYLGQDHVAGRMTERVVDDLEAVQVDEQHRHLRVSTLGMLQHLGDLLAESGAVAQSRQRVEARIGGRLAVPVMTALERGERAEGWTQQRQNRQQQQLVEVRPLQPFSERAPQGATDQQQASDATGGHACQPAGQCDRYGGEDERPEAPAWCEGDDEQYSRHGHEHQQCCATQRDQRHAQSVSVPLRALWVNVTTRSGPSVTGIECVTYPVAQQVETQHCD